jgi:GT2 family glycosyltransferase
MELSVIVPVRDDAARLAKLLASLRAQTLAPERFEVIVVANGCRDDSAATALAAGARVVEERVANRSLARNRGAEVAKAPRLAFVDADCVAAPDWLEQLLRCAATAPLLAGPVRVTTNSVPNAVERLELLWRFNQEAWVGLGWAATANLMIEREAFDAVGGFDPAYRHAAEDPDLCLRAGRAGFPLGYCADAIVDHPAESRLWPMLKRFFRHGHGSAQAHRRIGAGERAWRHPRPALRGRDALAAVGVYGLRDRPVAALAQAGYGFRMAGAAWHDLTRH